MSDNLDDSTQLSARRRDDDHTQLSSRNVDDKTQLSKRAMVPAEIPAADSASTNLEESDDHTRLSARVADDATRIVDKESTKVSWRKRRQLKKAAAHGADTENGSWSHISSSRGAFGTTERFGLREIPTSVAPMGYDLAGNATVSRPVRRSANIRARYLKERRLAIAVLLGSLVISAALIVLAVWLIRSA